ncbi:hypothetical protein VIGAN_01063600 [Vigna angularis var. angularis]|uniref:Succinate dehydrogenase assembly factor 2, mitochondrial n=1 Tax=Vigna angularis var. angularis TaxID=157739 RepID=A0A0S3QY37_PHAAN|nr:hypothetical protein VIGAN_01063600 [Vigna angularis var. angularis]
MASLRITRFITNLLNSSSFPKSQNPFPRTLFSLHPFTSHAANDSHSQSLNIDLSNEESKRRLFNRLLYRSKQRGFLELDLVLGKWVEDNIRSLDENRIRALVHVLDLESLRMCYMNIGGTIERWWSWTPSNFSCFMHLLGAFSSSYVKMAFSQIITIMQRLMSFFNVTILYFIRVSFLVNI